ncbi:hypothetical protein EVAR_24676_1 [Eumeta japonica]|uniref:Uncharacterized protein n=1 Tax=Eumeta variegata TaxID=151549 RepID=A0A4C1WE25_EUMVA|nr:hypothetical protein EVAR_24676_1 [Eumeta japonica]
MSGLLLETFCFNINLRYGALIVAYLQLIIELVGGMLLIMYPDAYSPRGQFTVEDFEAIAILLLSLTFTIMLIRGLHLNKSNRVKAYLIFSIMLLVLILTHVVMGRFEFPIIKEIALRSIKEKDEQQGNGLHVLPAGDRKLLLPNREEGGSQRIANIKVTLQAALRHRCTCLIVIWA